MKQDYSDIIDLPYPVSKKHPQMSMIDRAAQFSPFAALTGYGDVVKETARLTDDFREMDEETKRLLDQKMQWLQKCNLDENEVTICYFKPDDLKEGGSYEEEKGYIKRFDLNHRRIVMMNEREIDVDYIVDIQSLELQKLFGEATI